MDKNLHRKLLKTAIISSPIMGLYGVTPVYILKQVPGSFIFFAGIGVMINVFVFWLINIEIIKRSGPGGYTAQGYLKSYAYTALFHFIFVFTRVLFPVSEYIDKVGGMSPLSFISYPILSILALNTIILIICNTILVADKNKNANHEIEQLKISNLEAQKKVLIQQLQPHFLFNTLSVLKSLIKINPGEAEMYAVKLSDFLRYTVKVNNTTLVSVDEELQFTTDYIELQKVRFQDSLQIYISIPKIVHKLSLPAYALQTLVENAIKHNSFTEKKPLIIFINYDNEKIKVINNKTILHPEFVSGTGLKNLNDRYQIIAGKEIRIEDGTEEFCVTIPILNS